MDKNKKHNHPDVDDLKNVTNVASSTDFTGIVQGGLKDDGEMDFYDDLYDLPEIGGINVNKPPFKDYL